MSATSQYFDQLYRANPDPWTVRDQWYEKRKRAIILAALPQPNYNCAFEPGCGIGELTACLAQRSATVTACDFSEIALESARAKLKHRSGVLLERRVLPIDWPQDAVDKFDLIVVCELAYYFNRQDLIAFIRQCEASLSNGGEILACHWRHPFHDRIQNTDNVHSQFNASPRLCNVVRYNESDFLLDIWRKPNSPPDTSPSL